MLSNSECFNLYFTLHALLIFSLWFLSLLGKQFSFFSFFFFSFFFFFFLVLELYCRKAERKREGRKRETSHSYVERRGKGERKRRLESKKGEHLKDNIFL